MVQQISYGFTHHSKIYNFFSLSITMISGPRSHRHNPATTQKVYTVCAIWLLVLFHVTKTCTLGHQTDHE